jgi:hypothetical protein
VRHASMHPIVCTICVHTMSNVEAEMKHYKQPIFERDRG